MNHLNKNHPMARGEVAQNCILLYRGFLIRRPGAMATPAEFNSAIQQIPNLRYVRMA